MYKKIIERTPRKGLIQSILTKNVNVSTMSISILTNVLRKIII